MKVTENNSSDALYEDAAANLRRRIAAVIGKRVAESDAFLVLLADLVVIALRDLAAGRELYIPVPDKTARDEEIIRKFNGRNIKELAREFGLSRRRIYSILESGRKPPSS